MRRLVYLALLLAGCDSGTTVMPMPDSGPLLGIASTAQIVAWEGQGRFVTVLSRETGESLEGATVSAADPSGPLEVVDQRCTGTRCGVVLAIHDQIRNTGHAVPAPIDAAMAYLAVQRPGDPELRALLQVMPLDTIDGSSGTLTTGGVRFASSAQMAAGTFAGQPNGDPIRWVIFGDAQLGGTLDVSADGTSAGPGGYAGGAATTDGSGPGAGGAGGSGAGGGGGGFGTDGTAGQGAGGEPAGGGAGGAANGDAACAFDFFAQGPCGGSGGGGGDDTGGGGGGALAIVTLGTLDLSGATLRSGGGAGSGGGGGGAGGAIAVSASAWQSPAGFDVTGGAGDTPGGAGGDGLVYVGVPTVTPSVGRQGAAVDLSTVPSITEQSPITLSGTAVPNATVIIETTDGIRTQTTAGADGTFRLDVDLTPGLNRLRVIMDQGTGEERSWVGTSIELQRRGTQTLPIGALVDIAYVP